MRMRLLLSAVLALMACAPRPPDSALMSTPAADPGQPSELQGTARGIRIISDRAPVEKRHALDVALSTYARRIGATIGINSYGKGLPPLTAAVGDARRMAKLFCDLGFDDVESLEDAAATQTGVLDLVEQRLPATTGADDLVVVFFAGHGFTEGDQGYILPAGAGPDTKSGAISVQRLKETALRMKAKHVLYLVDACFSGSMLRRSTPAKANALAFWEARGVQILTAGGAKERVFEFNGWGAFTRAVHDGLEGAADADHDGVTTFDELAAYVDDRVQRDTRGAQHPQWGSVDGTGSVLLWDARRVPEGSLPRPKPVRPLIPGIEAELRRIHELMDRKAWADAEQPIRDLALRRADVELNLLLAEVYLEQDALGNSALVESELRRVDAGNPSTEQRRRALELRARMEKAKRGSF